MAKKINKQDINQTAKDIDSLLHSMYTDTYKTNPTNQMDLSGIKTKAFDSLKELTKQNMDTVGKGAFSQIFSRLSNTNAKGENKPNGKNNDPLMSWLKEFDPEGEISNSLASSIEQANILEYDSEIDMICEYMPILQEAIDTKRDTVLSADQFSKDFLLISNITNPTSNIDRFDAIKKRYELTSLTKRIYNDVSKYGEAYIYTAPYNQEILKLLEKKKNHQVNTLSEMSAITEEYANASVDMGIVQESMNIAMDNTKNSEYKKFDVKIDYSGYLDNIIEEQVAMSEFANINSRYVKYGALSEAKDSNDGLLKANKETLSSIPGAIVKVLKRANLIKLAVKGSNNCLGYFYTEIEETLSGNKQNRFTGYNVAKSGSLTKTPDNNYTGAGTTGMGRPMSSSNDNKNIKDDFVMKITAKLADRITPKFILNNQDLKDQIYNILKVSYNEDKTSGIKLTYIPPEFIDHVYWELDEDSGRGISDLAKSLIPAKLYIGLYITNTIGILTRGFDKRVYYVRNSVDTNISKTLLNTINIIKAGNKGMRDFSDVKSIIQTSGRYNDYLIPTNKMGESPIDFSVMEGQNIDPKESFMEQLEHMAVSPTGVPYEFLMSRKTVDYAVRLTMANGKMLKDCYTRQGTFEKHLTSIITKIYNYEYANTDILEVKLPPPSYLSLLNAMQMLDSVRNMVDVLVDMQITDDEDPQEELKKEIKKKLSMHYLNGYIDFDLIDTITKRSEIETSPIATDDEDGGDEDM